MLLTIVFVFLALAFPYGMCAFVQWGLNPAEWQIWARLVLALIYTAYFVLLAMVISDSRKPVRKPSAN